MISQQESDIRSWATEKLPAGILQKLNLIATIH
jgi:hypothetical protein